MASYEMTDSQASAASAAMEEADAGAKTPPPIAKQPTKAHDAL